MDYITRIKRGQVIGNFARFAVFRGEGEGERIPAAGRFARGFPVPVSAGNVVLSRVSTGSYDRFMRASSTPESQRYAETGDAGRA